MKISFPNLADYGVPIEFLLRRLFPRASIIAPPPTTQQSLELGARHSPDFVCVPFKYNLGNMLQALQNGADTIFQAGGGCRFGFYAEVQKQILRDLGYSFTMIKLYDSSLNPLVVYNRMRAHGSPLSFLQFVRLFALTARMIGAMDAQDVFIRKNIGFEANKGEFLSLRKEFLESLPKIKNLSELNTLESLYRFRLARVPLNMPNQILRVGIIGELYTLMEPFANYFDSCRTLEVCGVILH